MSYRGNARLRDRKAPDVVYLTVTGTARAVGALIDALASVAVVAVGATEFQVDDTVRVEAICYRPKSSGKGGAR
jgi:hypothetical protein